jgi:Domain of unknown function (DUF1906)
MSGHAGIDRLGYPSDDTMRLLWFNTNLEWAGFYLAPAPSHPDTSWMGKREFLTDLGWGLAPLYLGQQSEGPGPRNFTSIQGLTDGYDAGALASKAKFPDGSIIYLDIEGSAWNEKIKSYCESWEQAVNDCGYQAGAYCWPNIGNIINFSCIWVIGLKYAKKACLKNPFPNLDLTSSPIQTTARVWQLAQDCTLQVTDATGTVRNISPMDFSSANSRDPLIFDAPRLKSPPKEGRWLVRVGDRYTWHYILYPDGTCDWRDAATPNKWGGSGTWQLDSFLRITWDTGTIEQWDLPVSRKQQTGTLVGQNVRIRAVKISEP